MGGFSLWLRRSHLISTGRWLANMTLRIASLLIDRRVFGGRLRSGRGIRIGLLGDKCWHTSQIRQVAVLPVGVLEFCFPTSGISTHALPFGIRQDRLLQMGAGEFSAFFPQRSVQRP